ncbi:hypothetical protein G6F59_017373 [Rhizopus arrhizus]|nr:hypothetical protein G6F59_017373 [Rhizopus arrhizus]
MRDTGIGIRPLLLGKALVKWFAVVAAPVYSIALWGAWLPSSASAQQVGYDDAVQWRRPGPPAVQQQLHPWQRVGDRPQWRLGHPGLPRRVPRASRCRRHGCGH